MEISFNLYIHISKTHNLSSGSINGKTIFFIVQFIYLLICINCIFFIFNKYYVNKALINKNHYKNYTKL